jgi:inorganic triphosphatase YgiF
MAGGGREIELKLAVEDGDALAAVADAIGGDADAPVLQENHFFDTEDLALDKARWAVRLRYEAGVAFITFKGPSKGSGAMTDRAEEEWIISEGEADDMARGELDPVYWLTERQDLIKEQRAVADALVKLAAKKPLSPVGKFENERTRIYSNLKVGGKEEPIVLELDRTAFPDGTLAAEVELEIDAGSNAKAFEAALKAVCKGANVETKTASSKAARFFSWVREDMKRKKAEAAQAAKAAQEGEA